jgi:hypothetical protein
MPAVCTSAIASRMWTLNMVFKSPWWSHERDAAVRVFPDAETSTAWQRGWRKEVSQDGNHSDD